MVNLAHLAGSWHPARRPEPRIGFREPKLERVPKIAPAISAFCSDSGDERLDRLEIADSSQIIGKLGSVEVLRNRFGYAPPRIQGAREHLLHSDLSECLRDGFRRPSTGRRIRGGEADERGQARVGEGSKAEIGRASW